MEREKLQNYLGLSTPSYPCYCQHLLSNRSVEGRWPEYRLFNEIHRFLSHDEGLRQRWERRKETRVTTGMIYLRVSISYTGD